MRVLVVLTTSLMYYGDQYADGARFLASVGGGVDDNQKLYTICYAADCVE